MGKRIIQQARGKGSGTYRVRRRAYRYELKYPSSLNGEGTVVKLLNSAAHTAPLAKILHNKNVFFIPAFEGMIEGQKISFNSGEIKNGNILKIGNIPVKTTIYCIESRPGDGGIFIKTAGSSAIVSRVFGDSIYVMFPSKKEKKLNTRSYCGRRKIEQAVCESRKKISSQEGQRKIVAENFSSQIQRR